MREVSTEEPSGLGIVGEDSIRVTWEVGWRCVRDWAVDTGRGQLLLSFLISVLFVCSNGGVVVVCESGVYTRITDIRKPLLPQSESSAAAPWCYYCGVNHFYS